MHTVSDTIPGDLDEKQRRRNKHWSEVANDYHVRWQTTHDEGRLYRELEARQLIALCGAAPGRKILDVCCGGGRNSLELAKTGATVTGVDAAEGMLVQAVENAKAEGVNVRFKNGDVRSLPFDDESFDAVVGTRFMYMMDPSEKGRVIRECRRVVRPGGVVVLQFNGAMHGIKKELVNLFCGRGFRLRSRYLWPGMARGLFRGMRIRAISGVKLPRLALAGRIIGRPGALKVNALAEWFPFRHGCADLLVAAQKCE